MKVQSKNANDIVVEGILPKPKSLTPNNDCYVTRCRHLVRGFGIMHESRPCDWNRLRISPRHRYRPFCSTYDRLKTEYLKSPSPKLACSLSK